MVDENAHLGDDVVDLVLGHVDGQRRAAMATHLLECQGCRRDYDDLATAVTDITAAAPAVQPPLGFDGRVLGAIGVGRAPTAAPAWWHWRDTPRILTIAAVAATLIVVAVGAVVLRGGRDAPGDLASAGAVAPLQLADGGTVGNVSLQQLDARAVMVVAVVDAPAGVSYTCRLHLGQGGVVDSEPWPAGEGAWVVDVPGGAVDDVGLIELVVTGTDTVWSTATF